MDCRCRQEHDFSLEVVEISATVRMWFHGIKSSFCRNNKRLQNDVQNVSPFIKNAINMLMNINELRGCFLNICIWGESGKTCCELERQKKDTLEQFI